MSQPTPGAHTPPGNTKKIAIDPVTRIEGHLKVEVVVEDGKVTDAWMSGGMFRGFENILIGRDPRDGAQITQRICGVCPTAHSTATCRALEDAFDVKLTTNGRVVRNLLFGANYLQSHILHFYHLAAQDFVQGPETAPFIPRYKNSDLRLSKEVNEIAVGQYVKALTIRQTCHEMTALFGGKMPHISGQVVGGTTEIPSTEKLAQYMTRFKTVKEFIEKEYVPTVYLVGKVYEDLFKVGVGFKNCIAYGVFPMDDAESRFLLRAGAYVDGKDEAFDPKLIKEYVKYSWFDPSCGNLHPSQGKTIPDRKKAGAYSFAKAPRFMDKSCEVGPTARMWIENPRLSPMGRAQLEKLFGLKAERFRDLGDLAFSIMGRHVARAEETWYVAQAIGDTWLQEVRPGKQTFVPAPVPKDAEGIGFTEAPRGSLLHYVNIKDHKVANWQAIPATLWNCCPRDDMDQRGPVEEALIGTPVPDIDNPVNVCRIIRSYDP